MILGFESIIWI